MRSIIGAFLLLVVIAFSAVAPGAQRDSRKRQPNGQLEQSRDEMLLRAERQAAKRFNKERHVKLQHDTEKLLQLATELQQYVEKSNENTLSVDVVRKAEQIERLARSVKEKMRGY